MPVIKDNETLNALGQDKVEIDLTDLNLRSEEKQYVTLVAVHKMAKIT